MTQKRIRDYGYTVGTLPTGALNKITDVPGVLVGHDTIKTDRHKTGVTIIMPCEENPFVRKLVAAVLEKPQDFHRLKNWAPWKHPSPSPIP